MEEKKRVIWKLKQDEYGLLLDPDEIEEKAMPGYYGCLVFHDIPGDSPVVEAMNEKLQTLVGTEEWKEADRYERDQMVIALTGSQNAESYYIDEEWPEYGNILAYDWDEGVFYALDMGDSYQCYTYWDGHNWQRIYFDCGDYLDTMTEYEVDLLESYDLDEWDGSNWKFRERFNHGTLWKALIDGEPGYILEEQSQYQGSLPQARIFWTAEEAARELEDHDEIEMIRSFLGLPDLEEIEE